MANMITADRKATVDEVRAHASTLRDLAQEAGVVSPRLRADGTVVVRTADPGYAAVLRFSGLASLEVGAYVHVISDDVPAAVGAQPL